LGKKLEPQKSRSDMSLGKALEAEQQTLFTRGTVLVGDIAT
jgi:hypothetical protein